MAWPGLRVTGVRAEPPIGSRAGLEEELSDAWSSPTTRWQCALYGVRFFPEGGRARGDPPPVRAAASPWSAARPKRTDHLEWRWSVTSWPCSGISTIERLDRAPGRRVRGGGVAIPADEATVGAVVPGRLELARDRRGLLLAGNGGAEP